MQQQHNYRSLLLYPGLLVVHVCSDTGKYALIYNTKTVLSFIGLSFSDVCELFVSLHWSGLQLNNCGWL